MNRLLTKVTTFLDRTIDVLFGVTCVLLGFVLLVVSLQVVLRYFFNISPVWSVEATEYALVYITFLGCAYVLKIDRHAKMDIMLAGLDPRTQHLVSLVTSILGTIVCLVFFLYGVDTTWDHFRMGTRNFTAMQLPRYPFLAVIPVGFFLLFFQFLRRAYGYWLSWRASRANA